MTNEVTRLVAAGTAPANPINYTVTDTPNIEKGTIMRFSGSYIVAASSLAGQTFAGFANTEKVSGDGSTTIGVDTCGIFDCYVSCACSGSLAVGQTVSISGANILVPTSALALSGQAYQLGIVVGRALEPLTTGSADTIAVAVGVY